MENVSPLIRGIAMLPIIAMVVFMIGGLCVLVGTGLYIAVPFIADKVRDAWWGVRVRRIKRQMEAEV